MVCRADQASVEQAQVSVAAQPDSKIALFLRTLEDLMTSGEMGMNMSRSGI
jgi:CubicO group peptidase (beta-lactamase class C family)